MSFGSVDTAQRRATTIASSPALSLREFLAVQIHPHVKFNVIPFCVRALTFECSAKTNPISHYKRRCGTAIIIPAVRTKRSDRLFSRLQGSSQDTRVRREYCETATVLNTFRNGWTLPGHSEGSDSTGAGTADPMHIRIFRNVVFFIKHGHYSSVITRAYLSSRVL